MRGACVRESSSVSDGCVHAEARNGVIRLIYLISINSLDCGKLPYTRSQQGACATHSGACTHGVRTVLIGLSMA
jgi:hypothetical protein